MCRKLAFCAVLLLLISASTFCAAAVASARPGVWQKHVGKSSSRRDPGRTKSPHDATREPSDRSYGNNCKYRGGLAHAIDPQGLSYGHGLAQVSCPDGSPSHNDQHAHITIRQLIAEAQTKLAPPKPLVQTAPPRGTRELVGIPTWFWLDKSQWRKRSSSASAGGLSVAITASAYELVIDSGDGSDAVVCKPPWTPYKGDPNVTSSCTHTYTHSGNYRITVRARWGADWSGSGGGGTLPTISRSASFPVTVVQARSELIANP